MNISGNELEALLPDVVDIAREAGEAILRIAREPQDVREKADGSPLTRADMASHRSIAAGLADLTPVRPLLSEEGSAPLDEITGADAFWLVDPLDGTKEFIKGLTEYTVNIALIADNRPVLGVVFAPALDTMWYATVGGTALGRKGGDEPRTLEPSARETPVSAVVSRSHMSEQTRTFVDNNAIRDSISRGSSVKICAVAEGSADVYPRYGPTNIWDTGAGAAVAIAAGCRVVDLSGSDLSYDPSGGTLREGFIVHPATMRIAL